MSTPESWLFLFAAIGAIGGLANVGQLVLQVWSMIGEQETVQISKTRLRVLLVSFVVVAILSTGGFIYTVWWHTPPAIPIISWGVDGHIAWIEIDPHQLAQYQSRYNAMLIARIADLKVEELTDQGIEKSRLFGVQDNLRRIEMTLSDGLLARATPRAQITLQFVLLPTHVRPDDIRMLNDVLARGGKMLGGGGILIVPQYRLR